MTRLAAHFTGLAVEHLTFDQMDWHEEFDGISASASLLQVSSLPATFFKFAAALKPGGAWYLSLKLGHANRAVDGRTFTDVTEAELMGVLGTNCLTPAEARLSDDVRPGRADRWLNAVAIKDSSWHGCSPAVASLTAQERSKGKDWADCGPAGSESRTV
jgi:hypothetical protein